MPATDVTKLGIVGSDLAGAYIADSGVTVLTGGIATTLTATIPANIDGTNALCTKGWLMLELSAITTHYVSTIEITVSDGVTTVETWFSGINPDTTVTRGINLLLPVLATLSDTMTTIKTVSAIVTFNTAAPGTGNGRLVFNGSP